MSEHCRHPTVIMIHKSFLPRPKSSKQTVEMCVRFTLPTTLSCYSEPDNFKALFGVYTMT